MIEVYYPAIRPVKVYGSPFVMGSPPKPTPAPVVHYPQHPNTQVMNLMDKWKITYDEYKRRDDIVQELYRMCPYVKGDRVVPNDPDKRKQYGTMVLVGVCRNLLEMGHDNLTWPPNDNPMIATCSPEKTDGEIYCTTNFFIRASYGGQC